MALANYTDLLASVTAYLDRSDLASMLPDFVKLAETAINRELQLTAKELDTTLTATPSSRNLSLPSDFVEPISLYLTTYGREDYLPMLAKGTFEQNLDNAVPVAWAIDRSGSSNGYIALDSPADQAHTFRFFYRGRLNLAVDSTNWLMTNNPDVYLFRTLAEAFSFARNVNAAGAWLARAQQAMADVAFVESRSVAAALRTDAALVGGRPYDIEIDA